MTHSLDVKRAEVWDGKAVGVYNISGAELGWICGHDPGIRCCLDCHMAVWYHSFLPKKGSCYFYLERELGLPGL